MSDVISLSAIDKRQWKEGWDEILDAPPKPLFHRVSYPPRLSLNSMLITLLSIILLVFMGFISAPLPSPLSVGQAQPLTFIQYSFIIPLALFVGAFLGPFMGTAALLAYLGIGLFAYPIFANGGGLDYVLEPGFGYLLGTLVMGHLLGKCFHKAFQKQDNASRSIKIFTLAMVSVLMVHLIGVAYLAVLTALHQMPLTDLLGWSWRLTVETAPYDLLATTVFLCLVRQIRLGLWLVLY